MSSTVRLRIVDPEGQVLVVDAWIGMSATRDRARAVLARPPDFTAPGWESWGSIQAGEAREIVTTQYARGATPADVERWLVRFPIPRYWWMLDHDH